MITNKEVHKYDYICKCLDIGDVSDFISHSETHEEDALTDYIAVEW